ncbi:uncharacterized protein [Nicotiana sylvestris]|uniref:uncharacterized protein n=1 Tax=Nicotiana sylvestris TaxID=4096 RepID=UPI00388CCC3B
MKHILNASCEYMKGLNPFEPLNRPNGPPPKPSIEEAPKLELKPLHSHLHYAYLDSSDTLPVIISSDLSELQEEKLLRVLREHKRAIGWTMSDIRGISPAFCMHKILMEEGHKPSIEQQRRLNPNIKEVVLARCEETNLVDIAKVEAIEKIPPPTSVRGIRSFLGHASFYHHLIKAISKISSPLCKLLEKDTSFKFDDVCLKAFDELKRRLVTAPIIIAPDWNFLFVLMCDASDIAIGAVLGQRKEKIFYSIHYASRTLNRAQMNYNVTKKELLTVVWAFDKFRSYLVGTKVIVYTDHNYQLLAITSDETPWYADYVNFIASGVTLPEFTADHKRQFLHDVRFYMWDEPFLYKQCADQLVSNKRYILVAVDYVSKWVEAIALPTNDAKLYKEKTKRRHDKHIQHREFEPGQEFLLFNSRLKLFPGKHKSRWVGPFVVISVTPYGTVELRDINSSGTFLVNGQRVKHYWGGDLKCHKTSVDLVDA